MDNRVISIDSENTILTFSGQDTVCYTVYPTRVTVRVIQKFQQKHNFKIPDNNTVCYTVCFTRIINRVIPILLLFHVCLSNSQPSKFVEFSATFLFLLPNSRPHLLNSQPQYFFFFCWILGPRVALISIFIKFDKQI